MMNSNLFRHSAFAFGMATCAIAAEVSLPGGGKLTGDLAGMDKDGTISLISPFSGKPLQIRKDMALRVDFGSAGDVSEFVCDQRVELTNGDVLPVSVASLTDGVFQAESADFGALPIPRNLVSSIQLGLYPKRVIFSGPTDFNGWKRDEEGTRNWTIDGNEFVSQGQGSLSRDVGLTEKFILKFSLSWSNYPNFQFRFADSKPKENGRSDGYYVQMIGAGLGLFRDSPDQNGNIPIALLNRGTDGMRNNNMQIELRVDRSRSRIHLYVDGALEGRYTDPVPGGAPAGTSISLINRAPRENNQKVGNISIMEWDDRGDRHRSEERGDGKSDSLIGRNGERLGGKLSGVRKEGETTVYLFKSDFQRDVLEFPEKEVSTVFLGAVPTVSDDSDDKGYLLKLRGGGKMRVESCVFGEGKISVLHPLLGELEIARAGIVSIQRGKAPKAEPVPDQ